MSIFLSNIFNSKLWFLKAWNPLLSRSRFLASILVMIFFIAVSSLTNTNWYFVIMFNVSTCSSCCLIQINEMSNKYLLVFLLNPLIFLYLCEYLILQTFIFLKKSLIKTKFVFVTWEIWEIAIFNLLRS